MLWFGWWISNNNAIITSSSVYTFTSLSNDCTLLAEHLRSRLYPKWLPNVIPLQWPNHNVCTHLHSNRNTLAYITITITRPLCSHKIKSLSAGITMRSDLSEQARARPETAVTSNYETFIFSKPIYLWAASENHCVADPSTHAHHLASTCEVSTSTSTPDEMDGPTTSALYVRADRRTGS